VISDRFSDSTRVYQGAAGGLDAAVLAELERIVVGPTAPDLTVILDLPAAAGLERARRRRRAAAQAPEAADTFEKRDLAFHERLRAGYAAIATAEPARCVLVDGSGEPGAIAAAIWASVEQRLLPGTA
jgi:dTMP kinase